MKKSLLFVLVLIAIGITIISCNNTSTSLEQPPKTEFAQPVVQPLKFSKAKKIDWDAIKAVKVNPVVTKLNWDKLPETSYDTTGFKPFKYPVEETKFDYNSLPEKDLDIDKLPSHPLKFKTYILPPPKLIKGAKLELKNGNIFNLGFGEDQGAKKIQVNCLLNDHDGFLWIATLQGLYRYDGENLLLFKVTVGHLHWPIWSMVQDDRGNIWMLSGYQYGIQMLNTKGGILRVSGLGQGLSSVNIVSLMLDRQQRVWVTSWSNGLNIIDPKTQTVKWLDKAQGLSNAHITGITQDNNDNIWISTRGGGVNAIDFKNKKIKYLDKTHDLKSDTVSDISFDLTGRIWIGLHGGLINVLDFQKKVIQTVKEAHHIKDVWGFFRDKKGRIWTVEEHNGLEIIDLEKQAIMYLKRNNGLLSDSVMDIKHDSRGKVWIASRGGLNMISDNTAVIERIGTDSINELKEDHQGLIWKATCHGVDILDRKKGTSRHLGTKEGLTNDYTHFIREISGNFFITTDSGVDKVDTAGKTIMHFGNNTTGFVVGRAGQVLYRDASHKGINFWDLKNKTIKHLGIEQDLPGYDINWICLDMQGRVWIHTDIHGVEVVDPNTGTVKFLNKVNDLENSDVREFITDTKGNIWFYSGNGIYIADLKNQTLISFTTAQGLINDKVLSLLEHNGKIYAGTNQGITVITPPAEGISSNKKWQVQSYGLIKTWIDKYDADAISKDGLYWSGDLGISVLDLSKKDTLKASPYITGISVFDHPMHFADQERFNSAITDTLWELNEEKYHLKSQTMANMNYALQTGLTWDNVTGPGNMPLNLQLPHNQNLIQFHYSSFNFTPHDTASYRYILIGVDKQWSGTTSVSSTINYMNLQPGNYTFEVISRDADNVWSEPAKFSFTINPPWWQTWWAYILYVCLFVGTVWGFVYFRSRQLVKEKRILEHKVHIRTEEVMQQKEEIEAQRDDLEKAFKDLKSTQTQLIQSEKMASLGELTAGIAHEIQNPLNFVNNFSEVNKEMLEDLENEIKNGNIDEALAITTDIIQNEEKINHHGKRADGIVKGMLEHSRSRRGQKEPTDLNVMADEYMRLSYHGLRAKDKSFNAELITHFDPNLPKVAVVQQDIGRVLLNLFNNAFYAVNEKKKTEGNDFKPEVSVITLTEIGQVIIKVKDNGNGIPDAIKEKIMQPFFTTKPTGEGTGLGLSLTYDMVVKGHGGNIQVNSAKGEGAEFIILLPMG